MADKLVVMVIVGDEADVGAFARPASSEPNIASVASVVDVAAAEESGARLFVLERMIRSALANHAIRRRNQAWRDGGRRAG